QIRIIFFLKHRRPMKSLPLARIEQGCFHLSDQSGIIAVIIKEHAASLSGARGYDGDSAPDRFHARETITLKTESPDELVAALENLHNRRLRHIRNDGNPIPIGEHF